MDAWTRETDIRRVLSPRSLLFHRVTQLMRILPVRPPQPKRLSTSSAGAHASGYRELSGEGSEEGEWKDAGHSTDSSPPQEGRHRCRCHNMPEARKDGTTSEKGESSGFIEWHGPSLLLLVLLGTFMNMEYSILMPTVWEYLGSMNASKLFLGFVVGSQRGKNAVFRSHRAVDRQAADAGSIYHNVCAGHLWQCAVWCRWEGGFAMGVCGRPTSQGVSYQHPSGGLTTSSSRRTRALICSIECGMRLGRTMPQAMRLPRRVRKRETSRYGSQSAALQRLAAWQLTW